MTLDFILQAGAEKEEPPPKVLDIGVPINLKHEGHIGFNKEEGGFTVRKMI